MLPYLKLASEQEVPNHVQPTIKGCSVEAWVSHAELSFGVFGQTLPVDHGYGLYSALSNLQPVIHQLESKIGIQAINGDIDREYCITRLTELSQLRIRLPTDQISLIYPLAGKTLEIGTHRIRLGMPQICFLQPSCNLYSRIVVIKGYQEPAGFLQAAQRQLDQLDIQGKLKIAVRANGIMKHKTIKITRYTVSGFGLEIFGLTAEDSMKLQIFGLGGKRKMGCGIFVPMRRSIDAPTS